MGNPPEFLSGLEWDAVVDNLRLSPREGQIISSAMDGASETEIARILEISHHTVHTHLERLHRKLHVTSRPQLIARIFAAYVDVVHNPSDIPFQTSQAVPQTADG